MNHITNDLSVMLHTPPTAAEKIKLEYGSLLRNYSPNNELGVTKVPEMFLFSKSGKFIHKFVGNVPKEELEKYLKIAMEN